MNLKTITREQFINEINTCLTDNNNVYYGPVRGCTCGCIGDREILSKEQLIDFIQKDKFVQIDFEELTFDVIKCYSNLNESETNYFLNNYVTNEKTFFIVDKIIDEENWSTGEEQMKLAFRVYC